MLECDSTSPKDKQIWMSQRIGSRIEKMSHILKMYLVFDNMMPVWCGSGQWGVGSYNMMETENLGKLILTLLVTGNRKRHNQTD